MQFLGSFIFFWQACPSVTPSTLLATPNSIAEILISLNFTTGRILRSLVIERVWLQQPTRRKGGFPC